MNKQANTIYCILLMLTIWCTWNSVKSNKVSQFASKVYSEYQLAIREFSYLTDRVASLELAEPKIITKEIEVPVLVPAKQEGEE